MKSTRYYHIMYHGYFFIIAVIKTENCGRVYSVRAMKPDTVKENSFVCGLKTSSFFDVSFFIRNTAGDYGRARFGYCYE